MPQREVSQLIGLRDEGFGQLAHHFAESQFDVADYFRAESALQLRPLDFFGQAVAAELPKASTEILDLLIELVDGFDGRAGPNNGRDRSAEADSGEKNRREEETC